MTRAGARVATLTLGGAALLAALLAATAPSLRISAGALAAVAVLLGLGLRLSPGWRGRLALLAVSSAAGLYGAELFILPRLEDGTALESVRELRRRGHRAYPQLTPGLFLDSPHRLVDLRWVESPRGPLLPLGGIARVLTVECREAGRTLVYASDEHGFHNPPGLWSSPLEVAVVGDSFAKGLCVPVEQGLAGVIRERHPRTLSLGNSGNGPLATLGSLREYLPELRPRLVVWAYCASNDLWDFRHELRHPLLRRYLEASFSQGLGARQAEVDRGLDDVYQRTLAARRQSAVAGVLLLRRWRRQLLTLLQAPPASFAPTPDEYALFHRVLREAAATVEGWGGRMCFVYLPGWHELFEPREAQQVVRRRVLETATGLGIPAIDLTAALRAAGEEGFACAPNCHYSALGYRRAAEAVLKEVEPLWVTRSGADPPAGVAASR